MSRCHHVLLAVYALSKARPATCAAVARQLGRRVGCVATDLALAYNRDHVELTAYTDKHGKVMAYRLTQDGKAKLEGYLHGLGLQAPDSMVSDAGKGVSSS